MPLDARPPIPLLEIAIEAGAPAHADLLCAALSQLAACDPQITVRTDPMSGRRLLGGFSEAQLAAKVAELMRDFGDACLIGPPTAICHETIRRRVELGSPAESSARLKLLFEPAAPGTGFRFINAVRSANLPQSFPAAVRRGLQSARSKGLVAGFPVTDFWVTLLHAEALGRDAEAPAFEAAAQAAFAELRTQGGALLLEPVMVAELSVPDGLLDVVVHDLERRCARLEGVDRTREPPLISAVAPLTKLFGYGERLRELSLGRARLTMQFAGYAPADARNDHTAGLPAAAART
jgi:elongation factor G